MYLVAGLDFIYDGGAFLHGVVAARFFPLYLVDAEKS